MIDTHAHLDACDEPGEAIRRAREAGVTRVLTVGTTPAGCATALSFAETFEEVFAILGIHPHEAGSAGGVDELRTLMSHPRAVAVGETGLDFFRDYAPRDAQRRLFALEVELAAELEKPLVVHTRAADRETVDTLAGFDGTVVLHCFSSPALLTVALDRDYYVSFAGNVTYPKAAELREAARAVPEDRILAETDSPYLAPQPVRGKRNEPAYVVHTLAGLARARGVDEAALGAQIDWNALTCFGLP